MDPLVEISTDRERLDREAVHRFLAEESYWALGVTREVVDRSIDGSLAFGLYLDGEQAAFARAVTDGATFAWIADVFVLPAYRRQGLGKQLVEAVLAHPDVAGARRVLLGTQDAHELYERYGFAVVAHPERYLLLPRAGREPLGPGC